jgi:hypothetical protein
MKDIATLPNRKSATFAVDILPKILSSALLTVQFVN